MTNPPVLPQPRAVPTVRDWDLTLLVALGGAVGSVGRWLVATLVPTPDDGFAWSTWLVNISGAFLIGLLPPLLARRRPGSRRSRPFLITGLLGGWTTFSTAMLDLHVLIMDGSVVVAAGYLVSTLVVGLLAVIGGDSCARWLLADRSAG
ncbi:fluoride efflux transporter FluC [Propionibacteriaceae bacterium Y2011]|uniref:fluoride efflux transporter FluC n=1 Tax=Microlunatus sp. Y2014 TaxID=3418488 RepID=UPI003B491C68